ncbi:MAG TPA: TolC family protein [Phycisphaerae bacterium]|nr:TolC family protein [Phycisphaerae bacterium]
MMKENFTSAKNAKASRIISAIAAAALAAAAAGCASPFDSDNDNDTSYSTSIMAHDLDVGPLNTHVDQGVHEWTSPDDDPDDPPDSQAITPPVDSTRQSVADEPNTNSANEAHLSLQEVIADAMMHNLAIKVEAYNPGIDQTQIIHAQAAFDPLFFGETQLQQTDMPQPYPTQIGIPTSPIGYNNQFTFNNEIGVQKELSTGGTVYIQGSNDYLNITDTTSLPPDINPSNTTDLAIGISQPLLRGFGSQVNYAKTYIAQRDQRIAVTQFQSQVIKIVAQVEESYLELALAGQEVQIQSDLLADMQETLRRLQLRKGMDVDSVQISQVQASVYLANYNLVEAQRNERDESETLKSLLNDPVMPLGTGPLVIPTDTPSAVPLVFDLRQELATALRENYAMEGDRLEIEKAGINVNVAENGLLPKLDLVAATDSSGLAEDGSFGGAFNQMFTNPHIGYSVGLELEIPIGNRQAQADLLQAQLQQRQALTTMMRDAQDISRQVIVALFDMIADWQQISVATQRQTADEKVVHGLKVQEETGTPLTPTFLQLELNAAEDLADARQAVDEAIVHYNLDMVTLEQSKGTLLDFNHITIGPGPVQ